MESKVSPIKIKDQEQSQLINSNNKLKNIKSNFILKKCFDYIHKRKSLETIKYNKNIQKRMNININHYKEYSENYSDLILLMNNKKRTYHSYY